MTDPESDAFMIAMWHRWLALDELARAQSNSLEATSKSRDAAWTEFLFAARQSRDGKVLR